MNVLIEGDVNLRERVRRRIRLDVVSGEVEPGTVYSVPALAQMMGISTTPIREAFLQLTSDGLLQPLRNRGFRVVDPSLEELLELFDVRLQLETSALVKLSETGTKNVAELRRRADEVAVAVEQGNTLAYLDADRSFHLELLTQSGNRILTDIVMNLRDRMRLYGIRSASGVARQHQSVDEHYMIIQSVENTQPVDIVALMKKHIMDWQPVFIEAVQARRARNAKG